MSLESKYKTGLIGRLEERFLGCLVVRLDTAFLQGVPDLLMLWGPQWASLEVKRDAKAPPRPNQPHYVRRMNDMSFSAFIYPEIEEQVLDELQQALQSRWEARLP